MQAKLKEQELFPFISMDLVQETFWQMVPKAKELLNVKMSHAIVIGGLASKE